MEMVEIARLVMDSAFYPRKGSLCPVTIRRLKHALLLDKEVPPIVVCATSMRVVDGWHRIQAHKELKREEISADLREYASEAELWEDAVRFNVSHGRPLDPYDIKWCILRCEELGITTPEAISNVVNMPAVRVVEFRRACVLDETGKVTPLKRPLEYLRRQLDGKKMTQLQRETNERYGGMHPTWHARKLQELLDSDSWPHENEAFLLSMDELWTTWGRIRQQRKKT